MRTISFVFFILLSGVIFSQTTHEKSVIISNKDVDIEYFENGKSINLFLNGIPHTELKQFSSKLNAINGISVKYASIIPNKTDLSKLKIFLSNDFDKSALNILLNQYGIKNIIINGKIKTFTDLFAAKKDGIVIVH